MLSSKPRPATVADRLIAGLILLGCMMTALSSVSRADESKAVTQTSTTQEHELQLEVWINGYSVNMITPFVELANGKLATKRSELNELDIVVADGAAGDDTVPLDSIPGLNYQFDRSAQTVRITIADGLRRAKQYDGKRANAPVKATEANYGAVFNYSLFASAQQSLTGPVTTGQTYGFNGVNATLDGRFSTPYGNLKQSGIVGTIPTAGVVGTTVSADVNTLRLDSTFTRVDPGAFMTYRAGDSISGSLGWTQPIRFGGLQLQHNFTSRSDIVTQALPTFNGSAAAPSTVDVYVNNVKTFSQQVAAGPFQLNNIPTISPSGEARIVIRDSAGREVETKQSFYTAPTLLKPGLYDYSAEAGLARYNYGRFSDDYGGNPIASASLRTGVTDWLTAETHGEGGAGLVNGGAGLVASIFDRAIVALAASGSHDDGQLGFQLYGSIDTKIGVVGIHAQTNRSIGNYQNLATTTARAQQLTSSELLSLRASGLIGPNATSIATALTRDQLTVGFPLEFDGSNMSVSYIHTESAVAPTTQLLTVSYSRPFIAKSNLFATAFTDLNSIRDTGVYVGVSMPLGDVSVAASVNTSAGGTSASLDATKPLGNEPGQWGYKLHDAEGGQPLRGGAVSYRSGIARMEVTAQQSAKSINETVQADGSVVALGGNVYFANTINDGYAVVNAGAPGVRVLSENRFAGETDSNGNLLVPDLRSNQLNKLAIDPTGLPINAEVENTNREVVPAFRSGVYVDFKVKREAPNALLILKRADGSFVDSGSSVRIDGGKESFIVGYDGQAYVKDLQAKNTAFVKAGQGECSVSFDFAPKEDTQTVIGPLVCQ